MAVLQPVRGTYDLLPEAMRAHRHVVDTAAGVTLCYGFEEVATPVFEFTEVFSRTLGDTSDVVTKEMYSFETQGGDHITLRPENTAGVARAFITNGLAQHAPVKCFYAGPMFRYEKPQKGRQRQFHQIGVELIGAAQPQADVEVIAAGVAVLKSLGIYEETTLELNTLGDPASRTAYRDALVAYFSAHKDKLSEDSLMRLEKNPLRILDSKDPSDRELVKDAPVFGDFLNEESKAFFKAVKDGLDSLGIAYELNPRLVRGLDYYNHTCFEFTTQALGAQGTVMAGGRYDGLIEQMGGQPTPGVGWAAGIERLAMLANDTPEAVRPMVIIPLGDAAEIRALTLAEEIRAEGYRVEMAYGGNMKKRMKHANKIDAGIAIIMGDDELAKGVAMVKDLDSGEQEEVPLEQLVGGITAWELAEMYGEDGLPSDPQD
ncbi:histidine--tRNA ligase [Aestuariispira insulae]|uniref:Histidine--tRNA ligase n=1 Tax=Aestuariispira insulae TaxID=1461337 RepID=A0A3D9HF10_9PROT|nr:histidine--tRNA ligase [Aestuariispira insulae]RED48064.1 histidyl-tRNA synthetase [Aestuariispira insulae]